MTLRPALLAMLLAITPIAATAAPDAGYAAERDRMREQIATFKGEGKHDQALATMAALGTLAAANDDPDLAHLMEVERIFAAHEDAAIDASIDELNAVRARVRPEASVELQEALARVYGNLYFDAGNFSLALEHQLDALRWAEKLPTGALQARLHRLATIGDLYNAMELPDQALAYTDQALALLDSPEGQALPPTARVSPLAFRAFALVRLGRLDDALRALDEAQAIDATRDPGFDTMRILQARATAELAAGEPVKAQRTLQRLQAIADRFDSNYYRMRTNLLQGQARIASGDVADGLKQMRAATAEFEKLGQMIDVLDGQLREIETLRAQGAMPEAIEAMQRRQDLWSRLFQRGQVRAIAEYEARHHAESREQRIRALDNEVRLERARTQSQRLRVLLVAVFAMLVAAVAAQLFWSRRRTRRERDRLSDVARHDPLTGAYSRYEFSDRYAWRTADAVLLLDVDEFKAINDTHGHEAGDTVLKAIVARLRSALGPDDDIFRWGGEEFLVVLSKRDATRQEDVALALLDAIRRTPVPWLDDAIPVTVSGGLVHLQLAAAWRIKLADAIRWADAALFAAKHAGRDRVVQVRVTGQGAAGLRDARPNDVAQLEDWQRKGDVELVTLGRVTESRSVATT